MSRESGSRSRSDQGAPRTGKERVLVVDDEASIRSVLRRFLEQLGYEVEEAATCIEAERALRTALFDAAVLDYRLPDGTALDLLPGFRQREPRVPVLVLTGHASIPLAVRAIQEGADHFLTKPVELPALSAMVARLVEVGRNERRLAAQDFRSTVQVVDPFASESPDVRQLAAQARRIAASDTTVLIRGETGTGKGVLARWIHQSGGRAGEPFVDLNCAALTRELLESELFGHVEGAFTGAVREKAGLLEVAHHGTVFLDEIGDMALDVQPKLLKAIEEKRIRRLGDVTDRPIDVRLIAATHQDLSQAVEEGRFRSDLFYRINTLPLLVPPLRERSIDIPSLARQLLSQLAVELGRLSLRLSPEALERLRAYSWPGNIRELKNVLERAALLSETEVLTPDDLRFGPGRMVVSLPADDLPLREVERRHIEGVLRRSEGRVAEAARRLDVPRSSLYERIKRYDIDLSGFRTDD